ncbi:MAG: cation:proton antiporter [Pseudomonadota bacterium]|nr:cation:proton antiporter [Pseudomonadota bacterium]
MDSLVTGSLMLGLLTLGGLLGGVGAERLGLPRVAGYVMAGVLLSPSLLGGVLALDAGVWTGEFTAGALGVIAYLIGGSLNPAQLRRLGKVILGVVFGETAGAMLIVALSFVLIPWWLGSELTPLFALALAAVACTTAPAATVAVIHQYRASGPVTTTLLGVVALDDAVGIVVFSLVTALANGDGVTGTLFTSVREIFGAIVLGWLGARVLALSIARQSRTELDLPLTLGMILLINGLAQFLEVSALLACMGLGFFVRLSLPTGTRKAFKPVEYLEETVFVLFFTLAGVHFELPVLVQFMPWVLTYYLARMIGKLLGARIGAGLAGGSVTVRRNVGWGLIPQAGVAVGLSLALADQPAFSEIAVAVVNIIIGSTLLYELTGPLLTRFALARAGELGKKRGRATR